MVHSNRLWAALVPPLLLLGRLLWPVTLRVRRILLVLLLLQELLWCGGVHLWLLWVTRMLMLHMHRRHRLGVLRLGHLPLLLLRMLGLRLLLWVALLCLRIKVGPL